MVARTSDTAYLRLHGRNKATWNRARRQRQRAVRLPVLRATSWPSGWRRCGSWPASRADVCAMFNNNGRSTDVNGHPIAQAPANAAQLLELLKEAGMPVAAAR